MISIAMKISSLRWKNMLRRDFRLVYSALLSGNLKDSI
jgi:hypothetical protein